MTIGVTTTKDENVMSLSEETIPFVVSRTAILRQAQDRAQGERLGAYSRINDTKTAAPGLAFPLRRRGLGGLPDLSCHCETIALREGRGVAISIHTKDPHPAGWWVALRSTHPTPLSNHERPFDKLRANGGKGHFRANDRKNDSESLSPRR